MLRFYGVSESAVAQALEAAGGDGDGVEMTICARETEMHVDLFVTPGAEARADELETAFLAPLGPYLFSRTEESIEALILDRCREQGLTLATAESCTGGLVAGRLTSVPGSSDVFVGGIVAYADGVKEAELGVPGEVLAAHGAVSRETALAMARGARARLGVDVAVVGDRDRGARRRNGGEAGRARVPLRVGARRGAGARLRAARRPRVDPRAGHRRCAAPGARTCHRDVKDTSRLRS